MNPCLTGDGYIGRLGRSGDTAAVDVVCDPRAAIGSNWANIKKKKNIII